MGKSRHKNPGVNNPLGPSRSRDPRPIRPQDDIHDFDDPYIPDTHYEDGTVCSRCGAVYRNQHWTLDPQRGAAGTGGPEVICPGCRKIEERNPQGIVVLSGDYWPAHREEILNLIRNEEARAVPSNPLERIIDIREEEGRLIVETTNEKLAQRIGRQVYKAHDGRVDYRWSDDNRLVRVYWERTAA